MNFSIEKLPTGRIRLLFEAEIEEKVRTFLTDRGELESEENVGRSLFRILAAQQSSLLGDEDYRLVELAPHYSYYRKVLLERGINPDDIWEDDGVEAAETEVDFLWSYMKEFVGHIENTIAQHRFQKLSSGSTERTEQDKDHFVRAPIYLGDYMLQAHTHWGARIVLSTLNMDVCPSIIDTGWWEPWNDHLVRRFLKPGGTYVNLGANFGYFSLLGASLIAHTGKAYIVEANPFCFMHLVQSAMRSGFTDRMDLYNACVHESVGIELSMNFNPEACGGGGVADREPTSGSVNFASLDEDFISLAAEASWRKNLHKCIGADGLLELGSNPTSIWYKQITTSVDEIVDDKYVVDLLQMDIEGAEPYALLGAKNTIRRSPNIKIMMEWGGESRKDWDGYRSKTNEMIDFIISEEFYSYRIVPPSGEVYTTLPFLEEVEARQLTDVPFGDFLLSREPVVY